MIYVVDPTGQFGEIDEQDQQEALASGYRLATPQEIESFELKEEYTSVESQIGAGAAGVARGATFGLSDVALTELDLVEPETLSRLKEYNPTISAVTEVGGAIGGAYLGGAALGGAGRVLGLTAEAATAGAARAVGTNLVENAMAQSIGASLAKHAPKVLTSAAKEAAIGAAYGAGQVVSEDALGETDLNAELLLSNMSTGALFGAGAGVALGTVSPVLKGIKNWVSKARNEIETNLANAKFFKDPTPAQLDDAAETIANTLNTVKHHVDDTAKNMERHWENLDSTFLPNAGGELEALTLEPIERSLAIHDWTRAELVRLQNLTTIPEQMVNDFRGQNIALFEKVLLDLQKYAETGKPFEVETLSEQAKEWAKKLVGFTTETAVKKGKSLITNQLFQSLGLPRLSRLIRDENLQRSFSDFLDQADDVTKSKIVNFFFKEGPKLQKRVSKQVVDNLTDLKQASRQIPGIENFHTTLDELLGDPIAFTGEARRYSTFQGLNSTLRNLDTQLNSYQVKAGSREGAIVPSRGFGRRRPSTPPSLQRFTAKTVKKALQDQNATVLMRAYLDTADQFLQHQVTRSIVEGNFSTQNLQAARNKLIGKEIARQSKKGLLEDLNLLSLLSGYTAGGLPGAAGAVGLTSPKFALVRMATMEKVLGVAEKVLDNKVTSFFAAVPGKATIPALKTFQVMTKPKKDETQRDAFGRLSEDLNNLVSSPEALANNLGENLHGLMETAPNIGAELALNAMSQIKFLQSKLPRNPYEGTIREPHWKPKDSEIATFNRYLHAVEQPLEILGLELSQGRVSNETLEVLETFYPRVLEKLRIKFLDHLDKFPELSTSKQRLISRITGIPYSPVSVDSSSAKEGGQGGGVPAGRLKELPGTEPAMVDRLATF